MFVYSMRYTHVYLRNKPLTVFFVKLSGTLSLTLQALINIIKYIKSSMMMMMMMIGDRTLMTFKMFSCPTQYYNQASNYFFYI